MRSSPHGSCSLVDAQRARLVAAGAGIVGVLTLAPRLGAQASDAAPQGSASGVAERPASPPSDASSEAAAALRADRSTPPLILLVRSAGDEAVAARLRAELEQSHWSIVEIRPDERRGGVPLAEIAMAQRATAAVRAHTARGEIEIFVMQSGEGIAETLAVPKGPDDDRLLALRATETLRARGLDLGPSDLGPPPPENLAPPVAPAASGPPIANDALEIPNRKLETAPHGAASLQKQRLWLELAPATAFSPGGLPPALLAALGLRVDVSSALSLALTGLVPLAPQTLGGPEGTAQIATVLLGGGLDAEWARGAIGGVSSGAGAVASITTMSGEPSAGFRGADDTVTGWAPLLRSSANLALAQGFRFVVRATGGLTIPQVRVHFGGREAARWGAPFVVLSLGVEAPLAILSARP